MFDAIVISDLHLCSEVCCASELVDFLDKVHSCEIATKRLILNGDVFDNHDFRRLKKLHWKVLSILRKMSDNLDIVWIAGNHDGPAETISHLLGIQVVNEYDVISGGRKILILHGDQFDNFILKHPVLTWIGDHIYRFSQRLDKSHRLSIWLKKRSKLYSKCSDLVEELACRWARKRNYDAVICGHTHAPTANNREDVSYYNSGCWTEYPCHYLTIKSGDINLISFPKIL